MWVWRRAASGLSASIAAWIVRWSAPLFAASYPCSTGILTFSNIRILGLLNWFRAKGQMSTGAVESLNNRAKLTTRKAYRFRSYRCLKIALYHTLADLPEPEVARRLC